MVARPERDEKKEVKRQTEARLALRSEKQTALYP